MLPNVFSCQNGLSQRSPGEKTSNFTPNKNTDETFAVTMSSNDLLHHMACDFAQWIDSLVPGWDEELQPADSFIDTIHCAFGDAPTPDTIVAAYKSGTAARAVREQMTKFWETDLITEDAANALVERAIINNLGRDAIA